ncbi:MAG: dockerin type I repeat-containing protein [Firmicutes bacterium]|nr:dockerin type I repeat-containing protein [Bacillota bacterium]
MAHATAAAAAEEKLIAPWNESVYYDYWLRTPETKNLSIVRVVLYNGYIMESSADGSLVGVRPAFYLDQNAAVITGGSGSETEPYVINGSETDSFVYGDADGNNTVTSSDSSYILQKALIGTFELPIQSKTENWLEYVDVDDNNEVTASDASYVLQKTLVSTFELPAEKNKVK